MKFTNEQALESLKSELTNKGRKTLRMSDRSLKSLTDTLIAKLADDETGLPDFISSALEILNPVNDNIGKDRSDFIKNWEKEHPVNGDNGAEQNPSDVSQNQESSANPELKALIERIDKLEKEKADAEKQRTIAQKRKDVVTKLKEKGVKDDEWMSDFLSEVNITEEFDVDSKVESYVKLYNKSKATAGSPVPPAIPNGGAPAGQNSLSDVSALAKQRRAQMS